MRWAVLCHLEDILWGPLASDPAADQASAPRIVLIEMPVEEARSNSVRSAAPFKITRSSSLFKSVSVNRIIRRRSLPLVLGRTYDEMHWKAKLNKTKKYRIFIIKCMIFAGWKVLITKTVTEVLKMLWPEAIGQGQHCQDQLKAFHSISLYRLTFSGQINLFIFFCFKLLL